MLTVHEQLHGRRCSIDQRDVKRCVQRIGQFTADRDRATKRLIFEGKGLEFKATVFIMVLLLSLMLLVVVVLFFVFMLVVMMHLANHPLSLNIVPAGTKVDIKPCGFETRKRAERRLTRLNRLHKGFFADDSNFLCDLVQDDAPRLLRATQVKDHLHFGRVVGEESGLLGVTFVFILMLVFMFALFMRLFRMLFKERVVCVSDAKLDAVKKGAVQIELTFEGNNLGVCLRNNALTLVLVMTFLTFVVFALVIVIMIFTLVLLTLMALFMTTVFSVKRNTIGVAEVLIRGPNITPVARL